MTTKYYLYLLMLILMIQLLSTQSENANIGDNRNISLKFLNISNQTYKFSVIVDSFVALKVSGIKNISLSNNQQINLSISYQSSDSQNILIVKQNQTQHRQIISVVITLQQGIFQNIVLDTVGCQNDCFETGNFSSDPKVFISWIGTDANGDYLLSHTRRISRYTQYSVENLISIFS